MQDTVNSQNTQSKQIRIGEYDFYIQGVVRKDSNGYDLKTSKGNTYSKLKLIVLDSDETHYVYKMVFGRRDIQEIVNAINNPALTHIFKTQDDDFELETLIGEKGRLLMGRRFHEGKNYPQIECFIKSRSLDINNILKPISNHMSQLTNNEPALDDDVPF